MQGYDVKPALSDVNTVRKKRGSFAFGIPCRSSQTSAIVALLNLDISGHVYRMIQPVGG